MILGKECDLSSSPVFGSIYGKQDRNFTRTVPLEIKEHGTGKKFSAISSDGSPNFICVGILTSDIL